MSNFNDAAARRAKLTQQIIPVRHLKYLRKNFDTLILAYSGGTDSTLLMLIMKDYDIDPDQIVYTNTGLEYKENLDYVATIIPALEYQDIFTELRPEKNPRELGELIIEDFDKTFTCSSRYDKSDFRCCYYAKEKPMRAFLKNFDLDKEKTVILRGLKLVDSSGRMLSGASLIESGQFYFYRYKHSKNCKAANPIQLVTEERKNLWLEKLCKKRGLQVPDKSGCSICPIYYRFAKKEERDSARFKIAEKFIESKSPNLLPFYLKDRTQ